MLNETWKVTLTGEESVNGIVPEPPGGSTTIGELSSPATICESPKPWDWFNSTFDSTGHTIGVMTGSIVAGPLLGKMIEPRFGKTRRTEPKLTSNKATKAKAILVFLPPNIENYLDLDLNVSLSS
jgi:hypothetical protein